MARLKKSYRLIIIITIFLIYALIAAEPVKEETILTQVWINSLVSSFPEAVSSEKLMPFQSGSRFGYVSHNGKYTINKTTTDYISQSDKMWSSFKGIENKFEIRNFQNDVLLTLENINGYPFFLDNRIFIIHKEQNAISLLNDAGSILWTYNFSSPVTCVDAANGLLLAGVIDGTIELIDKDGKRLYSAAPSGSRLSAIYGCALSGDGTKIALISGIDKQRFIFIEQFDATWRITYHEFLDDGFRRPVRILFVDSDSKVVFEREGALELFDVKIRTGYVIPLSGIIETIENNGSKNILFLITSNAPEIDKKNLVAISYPDTVMIETPFRSNEVFLGRDDNRIFISGGDKMAAFDIENK